MAKEWMSFKFSVLNFELVARRRIQKLMARNPYLATLVYQILHSAFFWRVLYAVK